VKWLGSEEIEEIRNKNEGQARNLYTPNEMVNLSVGSQQSVWIIIRFGAGVCLKIGL
jgi:hypothetical protein